MMIGILCIVGSSFYFGKQYMNRRKLEKESHELQKKIEEIIEELRKEEAQSQEALEQYPQPTRDDSQGTLHRAENPKDPEFVYEPIVNKDGSREEEEVEDKEPENTRMENNPPLSSEPINYETLIKRLRQEYGNNDIVGYLELLDFGEAYIVAQAEDNDYYLRRGLDRHFDYNGTVFQDYRNTEESQNVIMYGHTQSAFAALAKYVQRPDGYSKKVRYTTAEGPSEYEMLFMGRYAPDYKYLPTDPDAEQMQSIYKEGENMTILGEVQRLNDDDEYITLMSCYEYNWRIRKLLVGRKIK